MDWIRMRRESQAIRVRRQGSLTELPGRGFTLVELLIVVIILGILAAIVAPQFTSASGDASLSAMTSDLALLRRQLELYRAQHNGIYPRLAQFAAQMTAKTKVDGTATGSPT